MRRDVSRREFIATIGGTSLLAPALSRTLDAQTTPSAPRNLRIEAPGGGGGTSAGSLLQPSDFQLLGYYDVQTNGLDTTYSHGLTHRYVGSDIRFLNMQVNGTLHEFSLAGKSYGSLINSPTRSWNGIGGLANFNGYWWEESRQRLWTTSAYDYTNEVVPVRIYTRTLNDNGTISNLKGPIGLQGINAKRVYGGAAAVPDWFRAQYGVGPYVVGWGGYTSLVQQGGGASMGPTMYALPDPSGYADNAQIPAGTFKTLADCAGAGGNDWYASGSPTSFDRGSRVTRPINYFDGGDTRQNPQSPPTVGPASGAQWLSPAPDGFGRFTWGDSYYNTGVWINGQNKHGFVMIASLGGGKCWYQGSTLHFDSRVFELHIFDPTRLGEAAMGSRSPWKVKPASMTQLTLAGMGTPWEGNVTNGNVSGATYDPVAKRLYLIGSAINTFYSRLYVYQVNA